MVRQVRATREVVDGMLELLALAAGEGFSQLLKPLQSPAILYTGLESHIGSRPNFETMRLQNRGK